MCAAAPLLRHSACARGLTTTQCPQCTRLRRAATQPTAARTMRRRSSMPRRPRSMRRAGHHVCSSAPPHNLVPTLPPSSTHAKPPAQTQTVAQLRAGSIELIAQGSSIKHVMDLLSRVCDVMSGSIRFDHALLKDSIRCAHSRPALPRGLTPSAAQRRHYLAAGQQPRVTGGVQAGHKCGGGGGGVELLCARHSPLFPGRQAPQPPHEAVRAQRHAAAHAARDARAGEHSAQVRHYRAPPLCQFCRVQAIAQTNVLSAAVTQLL